MYGLNFLLEYFNYFNTRQYIQIKIILADLHEKILELFLWKILKYLPHP